MPAHTKIIPPPLVIVLCIPSQWYEEPTPREQKGGWDKMQLAGNFNLFDLDFWFTEDVQDFVRLVLDSDQQYESRWCAAWSRARWCPTEVVRGS